MFQDYTSIMRQAEKAETKDKSFYKEAFELLSVNKSDKLSELTSDLEVIINLMLLELVDNKSIDGENLIVGCVSNLNSIKEKFDLLINSIMLISRNNQNHLTEYHANKLKSELNRTTEIIRSTIERYTTENL